MTSDKGAYGVSNSSKQGGQMDPDIGRCDDCGSEEGDRQAWRRPITVGGNPEVVTVWLCEACRG